MTVSLPTTIDDPLAPGAIIAGKYRIEHRLGEGGMGVVLCATHLDLGQPVAIKVIRAALADVKGVSDRLLLEARAAARIRSEHVTRVFDVGRLPGGSPYIVMEYLEGVDLASVLADRGPLPVEEAVGFLIQTCEALAHAHAAGIVHRDLKPENLFVTRSIDGVDHLKVLDFGISKDIAQSERRLTAADGVVGSPDYMAPEQMQAVSDLDARADIWALGVILYELLTGRLPFDADTVAGVYTAVLRDTPTAVTELRSDVPAALESVVTRCLAKERSDRYPDVGELAADLEPFGRSDVALLAGRVSRMTPSGRQTPARSGTRARVTFVSEPQPRRWPRAAGWAGIALGVGFAGYALLGRATDTDDARQRVPSGIPAVALSGTNASLASPRSPRSEPVASSRSSVAVAPPATASARTPAGSRAVSPHTPPASASSLERPKGQASGAPTSTTRSTSGIGTDENVAPTPLPNVDAWNTDSFGGRR